MNNNKNIKKMVMMAALLAIVVVLQLLGSFIKLGTFSITLVLLPITVGAILFGPIAGLVLGLAFGATVLLSGDAAYFMGFEPFWTVVLVLLKGGLAGLAAGYVYKLFKRKNKTLGCIVASIITPIVNTGLFALGVLTVLKPALNDASGGSNAISFLFLTMIGMNFIVEFIFSSILSPVVGRISIYAAETLDVNID